MRGLSTPATPTYLKMRSSISRRRAGWTTTVAVPLEAALRHASGAHWGRFIRTIVEVDTDAGITGLGEMGGGGESAALAFKGLEPYLLATAQKHPDLASALQALSVQTQSNKISLVHGDVSPKNIVVGPYGQPVLLDAECAWWGDPAFDLAF